MNTIYYSGYSGMRYSRYDFYDADATRGPDTHPYNFDTYYTWRPKGTTYNNVIYGDRMREWDWEKAKAAFAGLPGPQEMTPEDAKLAISRYYDGKAECVGYAVSCNQSSGYPIGVFFVKNVK